MKAYCTNCGGGPLTRGIIISAAQTIYSIADSNDAEFEIADGDAQRLLCGAVCLWNWVTLHRRALMELERLSRTPRIVM